MRTRIILLLIAILSISAQIAIKMKHFTRLFGLLVALFMFAVTANAQSVAINFGSTIATGHPDIFGMTGWPCNGSCKYDQVNFNYPG